MTNAPLAETLRHRFQTLEEERRRTWSAAQLAVNVNQRETLVRAQAETVHAVRGDTIPDATLRDQDGRAHSVSALVADGPVVFLFFRFAGCPACNIALPYYRDTLHPALAVNGVRLIALSPQPFPALAAIGERHALSFPVLQDPELALARTLGLTYRFDDASRNAAEAKGDAPQALNGLDVWELPKPAIIAVDQKRVVDFIDISPDWMDRTSSETILDALDISAPERATAA